MKNDFGRKARRIYSKRQETHVYLLSICEKEFQFVVSIFYSQLHVYNCHSSLGITRNWKISWRHRKGVGGGGLLSEMHERSSDATCTCPFPHCCLVREAPCTVQSVRWNTVVPRPEHRLFPENSLTETNWHMRCCTFICCAYERLMIHGPNMPICCNVWWCHVVTPDMGGRRCISFPSIFDTGGVQQISVHWLVVFFFFFFCLMLFFFTYTWHFCKWCRRIAHVRHFKLVNKWVKSAIKVESTTV